ncbi:DNA-binding domain-containing protein [Burkholderia gladioli]|uniref:HvfC/BufC N-terminal domain-containing protein n=1 Tax=Burkholderia gladioli TaxID=28095 RepID=UPI0016403C6D|nr:DNA-binding domain-containing protein [Burkholderia gladioli]
MDDAPLAAELTGEFDLPAIQHWMQAATTHPGGLGAGLAQARALHGVGIERVIATPAGIDPRARLAVYADGYWMRLIACLEAEFPALLRLLGPSLFRFFARAYLNRHPSRSPTLHTLGAEFPAFLLRSQRRMANGPRPAMQSFALALATLERAIAESGRAAGLEQREPAAPAEPLSLLAGAGWQLALPATTRLIALRHRADSLRPWLRGERPAEAPEFEIDRVAIRRHRFRVSMERLADWQFHALRRAANGPASLADCARAAARRTGGSEAELRARLAFWLPAAQQSSLVTLDADPARP